MPVNSNTGLVSPNSVPRKHLGSDRKLYSQLINVQVCNHDGNRACNQGPHAADPWKCYSLVLHLFVIAYRSVPAHTLRVRLASLSQVRSRRELECARSVPCGRGRRDEERGQWQSCAVNQSVLDVVDVTARGFVSVSRAKTMCPYWWKLAIEWDFVGRFIVDSSSFSGWCVLWFCIWTGRVVWCGVCV